MADKWNARTQSIEADNDETYIRVSLKILQEYTQDKKRLSDKVQRRINRAASLRRLAYIMLVMAAMFGFAAAMIWVVVR